MQAHKNLKNMEVVLKREGFACDYLGCHLFLGNLKMFLLSAVRKVQATGAFLDHESLKDFHCQTELLQQDPRPD